MADALSHIDSDGKDRLVKKIKVAAAAMADLWDELYEHEQEIGEFDGTVDMVSELAATAVRIPPAMTAMTRPSGKASPIAGSPPDDHLLEQRGVAFRPQVAGAAKL
ncbi:hypothetical protein NKK48_30320 [Mesorhizobium sp. C386A]|uniref:hypothetical protein n=1 Tax=Mesorhizobium sp. C386A TaxID=2956831 RepID=UPI00333D772C